MLAALHGGTEQADGAAAAAARRSDVGEDRELDELAPVQELALARLEAHVREVGHHREPGEEAGDAVLRVGGAREREAGAGGGRLRRVGAAAEGWSAKRPRGARARPGAGRGPRRCGRRARRRALRRGRPCRRQSVFLGRVDDGHGRDRGDLGAERVELVLLAPDEPPALRSSTRAPRSRAPRRRRRRRRRRASPRSCASPRREEKVDRAHVLVLDPEPDRDRERADLLGLADFLRDPEPAERVDHGRARRSDARARPEPGQVRRAAGEGDLADTQEPGWFW